MKKQFGLALLTLLLSFSLYGQHIVKVGTETGENNIQVINQRSNEMLIEVDINEIISNEVSVNGKKATNFHIENGSYIQEKGAPNLGKLSVSCNIPDFNQMAFEVIESEFVEFSDVEIAPSKGTLTRDQDPVEVPYVYGDVYQKDDFYPQKLAQLNTPYILNEKRGQSVWLYPIQYNPVKKVLRVYSKIKLRYYQTSEKGENERVKERADNSSEVFNNIYRNHFDNYETSRYTPLSDIGKMLIISYDNFADEMKEFVDWKKQRGLEVELVKYSDVGNSANAIKNYVTDYYNKKGLTFLLLVGDAQQIPSLSKSGDSDAAYGHIKGNDSYAEVLVGRFSAENAAQVKTQVERSIYYERDITDADTWLSKGMGIASAEGGPTSGDDGESDKQHMDNIRKDLINFGYSPVDQVYDPGASASTVTTNLNSGRGVINYVGHGSSTAFVTSGFDIADVNNLKNENKLPFIFDVACVNGNFHGRTCFAESWLRATNNGKPTGAVAIIASTINQSWAPPMDAQDEMNDLLVHSVNNNTKRTFGGVTVNGIMHMIDKYGSQGSKMSDTWTIFGDPSLILRNQAPKKMEVSYDKNISSNAKSMTVSCNSEGAHVCISKKSEIISKATVKQGKATLTLNALTKGEKLTITIVGQDKVTHIGEITVDGSVGPTCNDGIQNGDETGVDCGGSCPNACTVEPTCDDGIQNGDETGVDCGGSCPNACTVEPTCDDEIQNGDETGVDCGGSQCPACVGDSVCGDFGISYVDDNTIRVYHKDKNWTASWNYLCLDGYCIPGEKENGYYYQDFAATLGENYTIQFKVQDNNTGQYLSPVKDVTFTSDKCSFVNTKSTKEDRSVTATNNSELNQFFVYPNPANGKLYIRGISEGTTYKVYNSTGNVVFDGFGNELNTSGFAPGLFILTTENGEQIRFIKE